MFAMMRRPSATTPGSTENFESTRTICAMAFVAWEPLPMAIPRSASLRARASLTPSPVMATQCPLPCRAPTMARFCSGVTRPNTSWEAMARANSSEAVSSGSSRASMRRGPPPPGAVRPAWAASAPTVVGLSPEMTRTWTPCWRK